MRSPPPSPRPGLPTFWGGREAAWRGRGRVSYLFLFPGERPVGFGYERLQRRDVVVAQINLGQGQHVRGGKGGQEAATPAGQHPTLLLWSQGTESGTSVCLQETTYFLRERNNFPYGGTQTTHRLSLYPSAEPPPLSSLLHPRIPLAFSAHRSSRIFFLALASLYLLTPS